jgi:transketolase
MPKARKAVDEEVVRELEEIAAHIRRDLIEMTWHSGTKALHIGGSLSMAEIMAVLYFRILRLDPADPRWPDRDRFIMSKGHASAVQYAAMARKGFFPLERLLDSFERVDKMLEEHISMRCPGAEIPTGALGMGLSVGCGMAWGAKRQAQGGPSPFRVYVILGDGESQEGQVWEAAMAAAHFNLDNIIAVTDYGGLSASGSIAEGMDLEPLVAKWQAFGWAVCEIEGHDVAQIIEALEEAKDSAYAPGKPRMIIAHTTKGKGVSFMENDFRWHAGHLTEEQYQQARKELRA